MHRRRAVLIVVIALAVRLVFVLTRGPELMRPLEDQRMYLRMGRAVAEGRGLTLDPREYHPLEGGQWKWQVMDQWVDPYDPGMGVAQPGTPTAIIEPLYPLVLGALDCLHANVILNVRILQAFLGAVTAVLLYGIGTTINARTGLLAGMGFALFPHAIYYSGMVATETLFIAFQALAFLAWVRWSSTPSAGRAVLFGLSSGAAFLARSAMLPIAGIAVAVAVISNRRSVRSLAVVVCGFALATAPWVIRNGVELGEYRLMPTKDGLNLWMQNHPGIQQLQLERIGTPIPQAMINGISCRELEAFPQFPDSVPEVQRNHVLSARAFAYIRCNPRYFLHMCWLRMKWYLRFTGSTVRSGMVDAVSAVTFAALLGLAFVGGFAGRRSLPVRVSILGWLAYLALHAVFHGGIRYRIPADSLLIVAAACGADHLLGRWRRRSG